MNQAPVPPTRVLVVDDEPNICFLLEVALRQQGFEVQVASTGRAALGALSRQAPDIVLLDVMLPDLDGFEVCRRMREGGSRVPILFLSAKDTTEDKVRGLTLGGDDYVTKPFSLEEVVVRINTILRRHGRAAPSSRLTFADLELDDDSHSVRRSGVLLELSPTEYKLLRFLLANAGRVMSRSQILDHVWEYDFGGRTSVVDTYVSYLRRKVDRFDPPLIQTIRGVGFCMRLDA
jgi:two-component system, OmpR family, response regulator